MENKYKTALLENENEICYLKNKIKSIESE